MSQTIYEDLEDNIITALAPLAAGNLVEVVLWPDNEAEFKRPFVRPRITVRYHSFTGGDPIDTATSVSPKSISVQVCFEAQKMRGVLGIYDLECRAEAILQGLKLDNYKRFTIGQFTFNERSEAGIWTYNLLIKTEGASNQVFDDVTPADAIIGLPTGLPLALRRASIMAPASIALLYNAALNSTIVPDITDFKVTPGHTISAIAIMGALVLLTIVPPYVTGESVAIHYIPGVNELQDISGELAPAIVWKPVINLL